MANVIALDTYRPHLILCEDGPKAPVHVIPVRLALEWANGDAPLPGDGIVRRIITEWLACVQQDLVQTALQQLDVAEDGR